MDRDDLLRQLNRMIDNAKFELKVAMEYPALRGSVENRQGFIEGLEQARGMVQVYDAAVVS